MSTTTTCLARTDYVTDSVTDSKLRTFGTENVDYIDKTKPQSTIMEDIYCDPENHVISHEFMNRQWITFLYKDHILRLHLDIDRDQFRVFFRLVCDNVKRLLGNKLENFEENTEAVHGLLRTLDGEVMALQRKIGTCTMLPV